MNTAAEVFVFLKAKDLEGPATVLFNNGVRGKDLLPLTVDLLVADLRMSRLAFRSILEARDAFLNNPH